jgi:chromosome segregation ATPase
MSWKSLFASGELTELPKELTDLLPQTKRDSKALRELLKQSETAVKKLEHFADPLEAMQVRARSMNAQMSELQGRVDSFDEAVSTIDAVAAQETSLAESQDAHASAYEAVSKQLIETEVKVSDFGDDLQSAGLVKQELEDFVGPNGALATVRVQVEDACEQSLAYAKEVARIRED